MALTTEDTAMLDGSIELWRAVLDTAQDGIVICEARGAEHPLVYANSAFWRLTGYTPEDLLGQDLRRLQSWDQEQTEERSRLRVALTRGESCRALLRNYRKDGTQFWNELQIAPLPGPDGVRRFVGYHRDVSERERSALRRSLQPARLRDDRLSGLCSRAYFEERLQQDWQDGLSQRCLLTLLAFDIDELAGYNDTFGRAAGDACLRRVASVVGASFRRGSDVVARWEGDCIVALMHNADPAAIPGFAAAISQKILELRIHHPRAQRQKFISVSVGAASLAPGVGLAPRVLLDKALQALERAQHERLERPAPPEPGARFASIEAG